MPTTVDEALLADSVDLLRRAGELTLELFRSDNLAVENKGDGTPVTEADRRAERFLREEIEKRFPDDGILGEEEAERAGTSGRCWVVDPIDGTKAFTQGVPLYTNLMALEDEDGTALGVINMPGLGETVYAARGLGCWCNGSPCRVSDRAELPGSYLSTSGFDYWPDDLLAATKETGLALRTWGDGYGYALVATGRVDAMVDPVAAHWDLAPMPVIIGEAGGRFTDLSGAATATGGSGVATNGLLHDDLLAALDPEG